MPPLEISRSMGHAKVTTTLSIYTHLFGDDHAESMAALEAMRRALLRRTWCRCDGAGRTGLTAIDQYARLLSETVSANATGIGRIGDIGGRKESSVGQHESCFCSPFSPFPVALQ
jgi:hypothetical protein